MPVVKRIGYAERAGLYQTEYATTVDHTFLRALVTERVRSILEIPSGVGRNLDWLAATGRNVVMADLEPEMIRRLAARIAERHLSSRITALVADMRSFEFAAAFDLVLVPQGGLQLLACMRDARRALDRFRRHLAPAGTVLVDLATFDAYSGGEEEARPAYFDAAIPNGLRIDEWVRPLPAGGHLTRSRTQHLGGRVLRTTFFYAVAGEDGGVDQSSFVMLSRRYRYDEMVSMVASARLGIRHVFRNYRGDPYNGAGHRMIFVLSAA